MPRHPAVRIPYCGQVSAPEEPLPEPSADEITRQRLEAENAELLGRLHNLEAALRVAGRVLQPYFHRLNGSRE